MEYCYVTLSWGDMNKHLFTTDRALKEQRDNSTNKKKNKVNLKKKKQQLYLRIVSESFPLLDGVTCLQDHQKPAPG